MPKGNLNALVGKKPSWASKTESRVSQADTKFANLLIDSLVLNPDNQNYNSRDEADKIPFEELVTSIKLIGIRQPLDVEEIDGNKYMIISGERRYKAAKEAKLKVVPCVIKSSESKPNGTRRINYSITEEGKEYYKQLRLEYIKYVNTANRVLGLPLV